MNKDALLLVALLLIVGFVGGMEACAEVRC